MNELPKACVILGAGASHDVHGEGSRIINNDYRPPLAIEFFDIDRNHAYYNVLHPYPGARALAQQLAPIVKSGQISIEEELLRYAKHHSPQIRSQFKHVPPYLRDLIYLSSTQYTSVPSSYSQLVHELLAEYPHDVLFMVLNYDNLLESALNLYDSEYNFKRVAQYISEDRQAKVVKLHGSINWFRRVSNAGNLNWIDAVKDCDIFQQVDEGELIVRDNITQVSGERIKDNYWVYPVLTAPLASKGISEAVCPKSHIDVAKEFLSDCQKFLIIGTSGLDNDLLSIIDSVLVDSMKYCHIHIVGIDEGANQCSTRFKQGVRAFKDYITGENTFKIGFRGYLRSQHFQSFTKFDAYRD